MLLPWLQKNLCEECLKLKNHINHKIYNIKEIQLDEKELKTIENTIIKYYDNLIKNLEEEKQKN